MSTFQLRSIDSDQDYQASFNVMREEAQRQGCTHLVLDTALANALGQRFYFRQGLLAKGMHFSQPL